MKEYLQGDFLLLVGLIIFMLIGGLLLEIYFWSERKCKDGKTHDWRFLYNSKGKTGDLGFGFKAYWDVDYYKCTKCGKKKEEENL